MDPGHQFAAHPVVERDASSSSSARDWGVSVGYLGSHSDRLWAQVALNPGIYMGLGPCTLNGVAYPVCSTNANLNQRRVLFQQNPREAALIGALDINTDVGYQNYRGLKLSAVRRAAGGLSLNGNYTLSRCKGTPTAPTLQPDQRRLPETGRPVVRRRLLRSGSHAPGDADAGYETPELASPALRAIASNWRLSGISQRALGQPPQYPERHRQRVHRHHAPAAEQGRATTSTGPRH